jgi:sec-independent protein translocase protein TatA
MGISIWQILIIVLIVVVLFGAGRIPRLMGDLAKGIKSFKAGMQDDNLDSSAKPASRVEHGTSTQASSQHKDNANT